MADTSGGGFEGGGFSAGSGGGGGVGDSGGDFSCGKAAAAVIDNEDFVSCTIVPMESGNIARAQVNTGSEILPFGYHTTSNDR